MRIVNMLTRTPRCLLTACAIAGLGVPTGAFAAEMSPQEKVSAYLAAGEFQAASGVAQGLDDASARDELFSQIAKAQADSANFNVAKATLNRIQDPALRSQVSTRSNQQESMQGGGADFDSLISLIETVVAPETWEAVGGLGTISDFDTGGGIYVDANGVISRSLESEKGNHLKDLSQLARSADLNTDMTQPSQLRIVSLTRLETAVREQIALGQPVVPSMKNLAGLYSVQYVFVYPESGEIVIAGPAAGWQYGANGAAVSTTSNWPTLQLDDLVTMLRTYGPQGEKIFGCSIDPRPEGLQDLAEYVAKTSSRPLSPRAVRSWANQLQRKLGLQDVTIYGVPADSRVARVIVEADYRMKLIGIGELEGGSRVPDFFELMTAEQAADNSSLDALRWWLSLRCESILKSSDSDAFQIQDSSVLCQSENQFVTASGQRVETGKSDQNNQQFASNFTQNYEELARQDVAFADLQNIFDLALVAGLIHQQQLANNVNWDLGVFADQNGYTTERFPAPEAVESVVNHKVYNGKHIVVQAAGGVQVNLTSSLASVSESSRLEEAAENAEAPALPAGRWWWDATAQK